MADYTFSVDGAEGPIVVGAGDDAIVTDLDLFDTDDTVTGGAASGAERLRFDIAGGFALSLAGYATITGFDEINVLNRGAVSLTVGQDFHTGNASAAGILRVGIEETGTSTGGLLDASDLDATSQVVLTGADGDDTLTGGAAADTLSGGAGDDILMGGAGADSLDGGAGDDILRGGPGADTMNGGAGDDSYSVRSADDEVIEAAGGGTDIVRARVDYTLGDNLENLRLGGDEAGLDGVGNAGANRLQGNSEGNALDGGGGDDRLILGKGDDSLTGGDGDDTFVLVDATLSTPTAPGPPVSKAEPRSATRGGRADVLPVPSTTASKAASAESHGPGSGRPSQAGIARDAGRRTRSAWRRTPVLA